MSAVSDSPVFFAGMAKDAMPAPPAKHIGYCGLPQDTSNVDEAFGFDKNRRVSKAKLRATGFMRRVSEAANSFLRKPFYKIVAFVSSVSIFSSSPATLDLGCGICVKTPEKAL
ncbi:MAG: hypothetical protein ACRD2P_04770 [Terriglobia bacterium]